MQDQKIADILTSTRHIALMGTRASYGVMACVMLPVALDKPAEAGILQKQGGGGSRPVNYIPKNRGKK